MSAVGYIPSGSNLAYWRSRYMILTRPTNTKTLSWSVIWTIYNEMSFVISSSHRRPLNTNKSHDYQHSEIEHQTNYIQRKNWNFGIVAMVEKTNERSIETINHNIQVLHHFTHASEIILDTRYQIRCDGVVLNTLW